MNKREIAQTITGPGKTEPGTEGTAVAPINIALCKYWGKRDELINLPVTSSLSISLSPLGTKTDVRIAEGTDSFVLNDQEISLESPAGQRVVEYLDLFRPDPHTAFHIDSSTNVPVAAGLASSASGFAALAMALDKLFNWNLDTRSLSILARLGSGSASRSVFDGFVEWHAGEDPDGMDCYAEKLPYEWPVFCVALVEISSEQKYISSRAAMAQTVRTSKLYRGWPARARADLEELKAGIAEKDIVRVGRVAEANALAMHATMLDSRPAVLYWKPETIKTIEKIWAIREAGTALYFTMDAGPNIKLLFEECDRDLIEREFSPQTTVVPFFS